MEFDFAEGWSADDFGRLRGTRFHASQLDGQRNIFKIKQRDGTRLIDKRLPFCDSPEVNERYMRRWCTAFSKLSKYAPFAYMKEVFADKPTPDDDGYSFLHCVTDYYPNQSLLDYLNKRNVLDNTQKMVIIYGIAIQLGMMETESLVHRDLRPDNIMLDDQLYPHIIGLRNVIEKSDPDRDTDVARTITQVRRGDWTDVCLAPEVAQAEEDADSRADSWSWAMIAWYLIEGRAFDCDNDSEIENFRDSARDDVDRLDAPSQLKELIEDCLSVDVDVRHLPIKICKKIWDGNDQENMALLEGVEIQAIMDYFED